MIIPIGVKRKCVEMRENGMALPEIYRQYFSKVHPEMAYETFRHKIKHWQKQHFADNATLEKGTYDGFIAHGATVQVDRDGNIVQAWIKEHADDGQMERLLEFIQKNTKPVMINTSHEGKSEPEMLEIPLYDQHFPLCDHMEAYAGIEEIVRSRRWEEINLIIGQDLFHNDDMRGHTSSGRPIEKVDMVEAWAMARDFYGNLISVCLMQTDKLKIAYSKGNHDESMSWAFVQMLKTWFPQAEVDDSMRQRKRIFWRECFIGITHGAYKKSTNEDLRGQFTIQFPVEFASAKVREIHAGHLHREDAKDVYGVMCRRLSRNGVEDEWSDDEGYVGAVKRFMIFHWKPGRLAGIYYV